MGFDQLRTLVYSTDKGRLCPDCEQPLAECRCEDDTNDRVETDGIVRLWLDRKGRKGKGVTLVKGMPVSKAELNDWCKKLKKRCGCGGAVKGEVIEIQGDQRDIIAAFLQQQGFKVTLAGG